MTDMTVNILLEEYKRSIQEIYKKLDNRLEMLKIELTFLGILSAGIPAFITFAVDRGKIDLLLNYLRFAAPFISIVFVAFLAQIANSQFQIYAAASYIHNVLRPKLKSTDGEPLVEWETFLSEIRSRRTFTLLAHDADYWLAVFIVVSLSLFQFYMIFRIFPIHGTFYQWFFWIIYVLGFFLILFAASYVIISIRENKFLLRTLISTEDRRPYTQQTRDRFRPIQRLTSRPIGAGLVLATILLTIVAKGLDDRSPAVDSGAASTDSTASKINDDLIAQIAHLEDMLRLHDERLSTAIQTAANLPGDRLDDPANEHHNVESLRSEHISKWPLNFDLNGFSILSSNPDAHMDDFLDALSRGIEAADKSVRLGEHVVGRIWSLYRALRDRQRGRGINYSPTQTVLFDQEIDFGLADTNLGARASKGLLDVAEYLKSDAGKSERILIEGHTDASGSHDYNIRLARARAEIVQAYLTNAGVQPERMFVIAYGEGYLWLPFVPYDEANRRVRIVSCGELGIDTDRCRQPRGR